MTQWVLILIGFQCGALTVLIFQNIAAWLDERKFKNRQLAQQEKMAIMVERLTAEAKVNHEIDLRDEGRLQ